MGPEPNLLFSQTAKDGTVASARGNAPEYAVKDIVVCSFKANRVAYPKLRADILSPAYLVLTRNRSTKSETSMPKLSIKVLDAVKPRDKDYVIWDDELSGFSLR